MQMSNKKLMINFTFFIYLIYFCSSANIFTFSEYLQNFKAYTNILRKCVYLSTHAYLLR